MIEREEAEEGERKRQREMIERQADIEGKREREYIERERVHRNREQ